MLNKLLALYGNLESLQDRLEAIDDAPDTELVMLWLPQEFHFMIESLAVALDLPVDKAILLILDHFILSSIEDKEVLPNGE